MCVVYPFGLSIRVVDVGDCIAAERLERSYFPPSDTPTKKATGSHKTRTACKASITPLFNRFVNKPVHFPVERAKTPALARLLAICTFPAASGASLYVE
jgi:hypothetical protein